VVGEVFLEVVRSLHRFEGDEAGFRAWVFTIAHRRLIDARRAATRRPADPTPTEDLEPALPPVDGEMALFERASTEEVLALLDRLNADQREVLVLRLVGGLSTREVAEVTGRSPEAVKGLAKRGLARLRTLLGVVPVLGGDGHPAPEGAAHPSPDRTARPAPDRTARPAPEGAAHPAPDGGAHPADGATPADRSPPPNAEAGR
jgi:RNA polymerase sigma factor (sigma-70 family)